MCNAMNNIWKNKQVYSKCDYTTTSFLKAKVCPVQAQVMFQFWEDPCGPGIAISFLENQSQMYGWLPSQHYYIY